MKKRRFIGSTNILSREVGLQRIIRGLQQAGVGRTSQVTAGAEADIKDERTIKSREDEGGGAKLAQNPIIIKIKFKMDEITQF